MFRAALAFIVKFKGSPEAQAKFGLKAKLKQMKLDGTLHPKLAEWAEIIKDGGNGGAHPDELPEPSQAEAEELGRLCRQMMDYFYEVDARITRARQQSTPVMDATTEDK